MIVAVLNSNLQFVWVSVALYPLKMEEIIGAHPWDFLKNKDDVESAKTKLSRCLALKEPQRYFTTSLLADESVTFHSRAEWLPIGGLILVSRIVPAAVRGLPESDVEFLRAVGSGATQDALAAQFGMTQSAVSKAETRLRKRLGVESRRELVQIGLAVK